MIRQRAIVGQGDIFLLPLLIQRAPTPLPQDALSKASTGGRISHSKPQSESA